MRTTLEIDDDVLAAAKSLASKQDVSLGRIVSDLMRRSLPATEEAVYRNGFRLMRSRRGARPVTVEMVNRMLDEEE